MAHSEVNDAQLVLRVSARKSRGADSLGQRRYDVRLGDASARSESAALCVSRGHLRNSRGIGR